jgi:hypothetical protein
MSATAMIWAYFAFHSDTGLRLVLVTFTTEVVSIIIKRAWVTGPRVGILKHFGEGISQMGFENFVIFPGIFE